MSSITTIISQQQAMSQHCRTLSTPPLSTTSDTSSQRSTPPLIDADRRRKVLTSRPPNSFILYRSDKLRELIQLYPDLKQTQISKMCADNWKHETPQIKEFYRQKQQEAKTRFLQDQAQEMERLSGGTDKGIIKRIQPTNTFIRYRTEMKKKLAHQFSTMNQKDVSRACGLMWRSEPEHVKMRYRQSYNKEKRDFERLCTSTSASVEPSQEALEALASVIAQSIPAKPVAGKKRRRMTDDSLEDEGGSRSVPVSPPLDFSPPIHSLSAISNKRLKSSYQAAEKISLPSCASLLNMAAAAAAATHVPRGSFDTSMYQKLPPLSMVRHSHHSTHSNISLSFYHH